MARDEKIDLLRTVPLFAGLDDHELERVSALADIVDLPADRLLMTPGAARMRRCSSSCRARRASSATANPLGDRGPGEVLGEIALLDGGPRTATVTLSEPSRLLVLARREFQTLLDEFPEIRLASSRRSPIGFARWIPTHPLSRPERAPPDCRSVQCARPCRIPSAGAPAQLADPPHRAARAARARPRDGLHVRQHGLQVRPYRQPADVPVRRPPAPDARVPRLRGALREEHHRRRAHAQRRPRLAGRRRTRSELAAETEGKSPSEIADFYTDAWLEDEALLNILPVDVMPKATDHIGEMI